MSSEIVFGAYFDPGVHTLVVVLAWCASARQCIVLEFLGERSGVGAGGGFSSKDSFHLVSLGTPMSSLPKEMAGLFVTELEVERL